MKKNIYLFITIIAIIAVTGLQVVWFNRTYALMEDKLCKDINSLFQNTLSLEVSERVTKGIIPNYTVLEADSIRVRNERYKKSYNSRMAYQPFKDYCFQATHYRFGIKMNLQKVDSIFGCLLAEKKLGNIHFKIDTVSIDTLRYKYVDDLVEDSTLIRNSASLQSQIFPMNDAFTVGAQVTIANPYQHILREMWLFLTGTVGVLLIALGCIARQIYIIRKQNKVAQLREDFSYAMIHDMKTPLNSILMGTHILRSGKLDDKLDKKEKYFDILEDESEHLLALSNKVLTLAKLEEGHLQLHKEVTPLSPMMGDLIEKFSAKATKNISFHTDLQATQVFADASYLKEAISNLIDNAIKYSHETVEITLSSNYVGDYTCIRVHDNGLGIPLKDQSKIFEKFERASAIGRNRKGGASGFGLGLNYVMHIMQAHGGITHVRSVEGEYSEFTLKIPRA